VDVGRSADKQYYAEQEALEVEKRRLVRTRHVSWGGSEVVVEEGAALDARFTARNTELNIPSCARERYGEGSVSLLADTVGKEVDFGGKKTWF
jgi:hypothetical protein